jgi:hypothetical protein
MRVRTTKKDMSVHIDIVVKITALAPLAPLVLVTTVNGRTRLKKKNGATSAKWSWMSAHVRKSNGYH